MLDPLNLVWRERLCNGDLMKEMILAEVAEHRLWSLNEVNEHRLKAIAAKILEGVCWSIFGEGTFRNSHYIHLPLFLITDL